VAIPGETISLRNVLDQAWERTVGGSLQFAASVSSFGNIKALVRAGMGLESRALSAGVIAAPAFLGGHARADRCHNSATERLGDH